MSDDAYLYVRPTRLKLKGDNESTSKSKKRKRRERKEEAKPQVSREQEEQEESQEGHDIIVPKFEEAKTEAERKFEEAQKKREKQVVKKLATKSHRQRVEEFNKHLEALPNHFDIPKVGPG
ncbi:Protein fam32a [Balamuthia mandrillaris]